ncbi:hypothetical protein N7494_000723 [Penicillium frequentans]|uniref:Uncharacterized protein n=1 Tax=Penicillium frequentans TaxID=3151616 RepID=A0AAD6D6D2_9EURO|nr:hypothetical protein N7494_000723 [Penicillium glabrum]
MKLTAFLTVLSLSSFVAAAPIDKAARGFLPSPGALLEKAYPHSGIPQLANKLDKLTELMMIRIWREILDTLMDSEDPRETMLTDYTW